MERNKKRIPLSDQENIKGDRIIYLLLFLVTIALALAMSTLPKAH